MNNIITISREFGSGGRELGKRLAEILGIAYYDHEIITSIAERSGLAEKYVNSIVEKKPLSYFPITIGRSFSAIDASQLNLSTRIFAEQHNIIEELAAKSDCLIIGRCSDHILREYPPLKIFVYADTGSRLQRCKQRAPEGEHLSDAEMKNKIREIDKGRAEYYEFFAGQKWGKKENYTFCLNTSNIVIKDVSAPVAELLRAMLHHKK